jgi:hypothetical protein
MHLCIKDLTFHQDYICRFYHRYVKIENPDAQTLKFTVP